MCSVYSRMERQFNNILFQEIYAPYIGEINLNLKFERPMSSSRRQADDDDT